MREIKFRVWHLWGEGFSILTLDELCNEPKKFHTTYYKNSIEQYTGLKDKNGVEIYEGDIVKVTDDDEIGLSCDVGQGSVEFYDGVWYVNHSVDNGLYDLDKQYYFEVIGNIHKEATDEK